jgi:hypothetical protein
MQCKKKKPWSRFSLLHALVNRRMDVVKVVPAQRPDIAIQLDGKYVLIWSANRITSAVMQ